MHCPTCRKPVAEHDAACPHCGFCLDAADRVLGIPPVLRGPVADPGHCLTAGEIRRLHAAINRIELRFPQLRLAVVLSAAPPRIPIAAYAFWVFNRGGLCSAIEKGPDNHLVMLLVDPEAAAAACMIGYGLEPFISQERLDACLSVFRNTASTSRLAPAILAFFDEVSVHLEEICAALPGTYGLKPREWLIDDEGLALDPDALPSRASAY